MQGHFLTNEWRRFLFKALTIETTLDIVHYDEK